MPRDVQDRMIDVSVTFHLDDDDDTVMMIWDEATQGIPFTLPNPDDVQSDVLGVPVANREYKMMHEMLVRFLRRRQGVKPSKDRMS